MTKKDLRNMEDNEDRVFKAEIRKNAIGLREDYRATFLSTVSGRKVLKHLQKINHFFDAIDPSKPDAIGRRNAVCGIMNMLCCADDPDKTIDAMNEAMLKWPVIIKQKKEE